LDFAVQHPEEKGRYVLALEVDGASYHSSETARDRDRIRQSHLEKLGWKFHRIWSQRWFRHKEEEIEIALIAIQQAINSLQ
jgi:very-short-patch-repair endonuclease